MDTPRLVVFGSTNLDILFKQDRLHNVGETVLVKDAVVCGGGKGANQAVQMVRLGYKPRFVTALGDDALADSLGRELQGYGLSLDEVITKEGSSGIGMVGFLTDGSLTSTVVAGANGKVTLQDVENRRGVFETCDYLIVQLELPVSAVERAIQLGAMAGARVILNTAPALPLSEATLRSLYILVANEVEAGYYLQADCADVQALLSAGAPFSLLYGLRLVVTLGPAGSVLFEAGEVTRIPALDVPVVETTGAGDSFVGALAVALADGWEIRDACRFATSASSLTIQNVGGQRSMPDKKAVLSLYGHHFT